MAMRWLLAAMLVAVIATQSGAEGLAEEADVSDTLEKWAYVPDPDNPGSAVFCSFALMSGITCSATRVVYHLSTVCRG